MGTVGNSVFRVMMGWIQTLSAEIWNTASASGQMTLLSWIGGHWKMLAFILCVVGLLIDLIVYLFRWQPYRVWRSFFMRRRKKDGIASGEEAGFVRDDYDDQDEVGQEAAEMRNSGSVSEFQYENDSAENVYTDLEAAVEAFSENFSTQEERERERYQRPGINRQRIASHNLPYETPGDSEYYPKPDEFHKYSILQNRVEPEGTTARFEQAIRTRRRRRITNLLSENREMEYDPPDQLIDQNEAYRRPVYPRGWTTSEDKE